MPVRNKEAIVREVNKDQSGISVIERDWGREGLREL